MWTRRNTIYRTRRDDFRLKVFSELLVTTVLLFHVLGNVGQVDCYNGRTSQSSQPKAGIKYLLSRIEFTV